MHSKPAVVRIFSGHVGKWAWKNRVWNTQSVASGSGFFINPDGYILTNAHVVSSIKEGDDEGKLTLLRNLAAQFIKASGYQVTPQNMQVVGKMFDKENPRLLEFTRINWVLLQSGKRFPYEIKAFGAPVGAGKDLATGKDVSVLKIETRNAPILPLGNSDPVQVGDKLYVIGYPAAAESDLLDPKSALEPTMNDGAISARKTSADGAPILQTSANTTHGNSGGPAINEKGEVIGLLTFRGDTVGGQEVQGFNFLVAINTAREFVRQAGTENKSSDVDKKWQEGLDHFWNERYTKAKEAFSVVVALFPEHSEASKLITESQEHIVKGEDKGLLEDQRRADEEQKAREAAAARSRALLIGGVVGVVLLVGAVAVVAVVAMGAKKKGTEVRPMGYQGGPMAAPQGPYRPAALAGPGQGDPQRVPTAYQQTVPGHGSAPPPARGSGKARTEVFQPPTAGAPRARTEVYQTAGPKLVGLEGPAAGQHFPIGGGVLIGREPSQAQVIVQDGQVSATHVWIGPAGGRLVARDVGSTNGTFLNGRMDQRVTEVALNDRDVLTLGGRGSVKFQVVF
jgi:V8-like Glu-specific endopeptidase